MKITSFDEEQFKNLGGKVFEGEGYSIRVIFPLAIRYQESEKVLTVFAEPRDRIPEWAAQLPSVIRVLFAKTSLELIAEEPLRWDNSEESPLTSFDTILARIEMVLNRLHFPFTIRRIPSESPV